METNQELALSVQPPHLKHFLKETARFLEKCSSKDASLINSLQNEKALLLADVEVLKIEEEKHKIALLKLQEKVEKLEEKEKELTKEKELLTKEQEEEMRKVRTDMEAEIKAMAEQLKQSKLENQELLANFKTMEKKYNSFKEFFQRVIQFATTDIES